jgi:predicted 2-oxoglutarate/Fe(II)-dependent dioxygenase YbiX|tara:strand:+ start:1407 stop:1625 length:219 start_codon:yes stop_codon:yes gene_type:complete
MSKTSVSHLAALEPDLRQRRTVSGFLEDLRAHITRKQDELAASDADRAKILAELGVYETLLREWDTNGAAHE